MRTNLLFGCGTLLALALCGCTSTHKISSLKLELLAVDSAFSAMSQAQGPSEAFYHYMATNATSLPAGDQPVFGNEAIRNSMSNITGVLRWHPVDADVAASAELGYTWGFFEYQSKDADGRLKISHGKYVTVWRRQPDGGWKAVLDCGNSNAPPP